MCIIEVSCGYGGLLAAGSISAKYATKTNHTQLIHSDLNKSPSQYFQVDIFITVFSTLLAVDGNTT